MVKLKDIAEHCGISITQVSRALSNQDDVSDETKKRVRLAAEKMGYVKNITAQRLAMKQSNQIAVILQGLEEDENEFSTNILSKTIKGINKFSLSVDYEPIIHLVDKKDFSHMDFCRQRGISGAILTGVKFDDPNFGKLIKTDFPCVALDVSIEGTNKGCVIVNNCYYSMEVVKRLNQKGRRKIAYINGHEHAMVSMERKMGYQMGLASCGITYDESLVVNGDFDYLRAYEITVELMKKNPLIDGIFCASDLMAMGSLKALQEMGIKVPDTVALFGFDGIPLTQFVTPTISTVHQDDVKKGYCAAKLLYEILNHKNEVNTIVVPCEIIERQSS